MPSMYCVAGTAVKHVAPGRRVILFEFPQCPCLLELHLGRAFDFDCEQAVGAIQDKIDFQVIAGVPETGPVVAFQGNR